MLENLEEPVPPPCRDERPLQVAEPEARRQFIEASKTTRGRFQRPSSVGKISRLRRVDAPLRQIQSVGIKDVINAVTLVKVNADEGFRLRMPQACRSGRDSG